MPYHCYHQPQKWGDTAYVVLCDKELCAGRLVDWYLLHSLLVFLLSTLALSGQLERRS
ncbi:hypothetical protein F4810DRAFT_708243 [Camillea tinctor]|nr:hypothetical protein F4810DRAFT_708243 [Camillea tinctor]